MTAAAIQALIDAARTGTSDLVTWAELKAILEGLKDQDAVYTFNSRQGAVTPAEGDYSLNLLSDVVISSPTTNQIVQYNGTNWVNATAAASAVTSVFSRTGAITAAEGDYSLTQLSDVGLVSPTSGQVLSYNGTSWTNSSLTLNNIYNGDGTLSSNRVVVVDTNTLTFQGASSVSSLVVSNADVAIGTGTLATATKLTIGGTETASSAIARGAIINTTLTAAANNDVLVGLDISPTFTTGAFTGVTTYHMRLNGNILLTLGDRYFYYNNTSTILFGIDSIGAYLGYGIGSRNLDFGSNSTGSIRFRSQGNVILDSATPTQPKLLIRTSTDSGYVLDVNGTARIVNALTLNSNLESSFSVTNITDGEYAASFTKTYTLTATQTNKNSYGEINSVTYNMNSGTYSGSSTYNTANYFAQTRIGGNTTTKATQPFRSFLASLVALASPSAAINISDFRFIDLKQPDANSVSGHTIDNMFGLRIAQMKGTTNFTITNGWGIYQEGSTDNNYFNGKVLVGTATPGSSPVRISGLPTSSAGLSTGDLWNDSGTIKIA